MDPALTQPAAPAALSRDDRIEVDLHVRRRKYGRTVHLVQLNDWYRIDAVGDALWQACAEGLTVEAMALRLVERQGLTLADALAAVAFHVGAYLSLGLARVAPRPGGRKAGARRKPAAG